LFWIIQSITVLYNTGSRQEIKNKKPTSQADTISKGLLTYIVPPKKIDSSTSLRSLDYTLDQRPIVGSSHLKK
jgi:hypothetical protein